MAGNESNLTGFSGRRAQGIVDFGGLPDPGTVITIDGFEYVEADGEDLPNGVWTNGANTGASATSLIAAINNDTREGRPSVFALLADSATTVILLAGEVGEEHNYAVTVDDAVHVAVDNMAGGLKSARKELVVLDKVVTALDVRAGEVCIALDFEATAGWTFAVRDGSNVPKAVDSSCGFVPNPNRFILIADGTTNVAENDTVTLIAMGG